MRTPVFSSSEETESASEYRLLCGCCSRIQLQLNAEQIGLLRDQMRFTYRQAELAATLIQENHVPRWYVWRGFPENHDQQANPSDPGVRHDAPQVDCDCERGGCGENAETGEQRIISIPLTEQQQTAIRERTGGVSFSLECSAEALDTCLRAAT